MECASMQGKYYAVNDENMTNTWMELANTLMLQDKVKEAMYYYKKVFLINEDEIEDAASAIGYNLQLIASIHESLGQFGTARGYCEKALCVLQKYSSGDLDAIVLCLLNISEVYEKETKYEDALTYALQALQIQTTINPNGTSKIIENQNNIGFLYIQKKDYETALAYYFRSVELYEKLLPNKNHLALAATFDNIATTYGELHENNFAIEYYRKVLDIYKHIIHTNGNR
jgi:tetratricopeptide (TPR) repeat protein